MYVWPQTGIFLKDEGYIHVQAKFSMREVLIFFLEPCNSIIYKEMKFYNKFKRLDPAGT